MWLVNVVILLIGFVAVQAVRILWVRLWSLPPSAWYAPAFAVAVFVVGYLLSRFKSAYQVRYGKIELSLAFWCAWIAFGKVRSTGELEAWVMVVSTVYFAVRGWTNITEGNSKLENPKSNIEIRLEQLEKRLSRIAPEVANDRHTSGTPRDEPAA
jgi:hypothetical protein